MKNNRFLPSSPFSHGGLVTASGARSAGLSHNVSGGFSYPGRDCA